jgi:hypothetical protein
VQQFAAAGLNFGYSYDSSPIISYDGEPAPKYTMGSYTPATAPGCRAPHFWLEPGVSLYDRLGQGCTLLRLSQDVDAEPLVAAAAAAGVPLEVIEVPVGAAPAEYKHPLVICREDQHIAWRGDASPADPAALLDLLRGAGGPGSVL